MHVLKQKKQMTHQLRCISSLVALLALLLLCSCGSSKNQYIKGTPSPQALSKKLGIKVTKNDYLYLYAEAAEWIGVPHRMGGNTKKGVDCSGFVSIIQKRVYGRKLKRSSADMLKYNCRKIRRGNLEEGDLVFFRTGKGRKKIPNHVGIYLKNGSFVHTSTSRGVMVSSLSEPYYLRSWITGGRIR